MSDGEIVLGVDTHKDIHVAAIVDEVGRLLGTSEFPVSERGGRRMLEWARHSGAVRRAGVEGTGSYGYGLARQLQAAGVEVREVTRPNRSLRRLRGKSDSTDAEVAARAVLSGEASAVPKDRDGPVGQLRALMVARRGAVKARTQTSNQIKALLVTCEEAVRGRLQGRRDGELAARRVAAHGCGAPTAPRRPFGASADGGFTWTRRPGPCKPRSPRSSARSLPS